MNRNIMQNRQRASVRILYVLISLCLFVLTFAVSLQKDFGVAYAETTELPKITIEDKTVHRGQTFTVQAYLERNPGLVAMVLDLSYDKSAMSLVGVERGNALTSHTFTTTNTETDEGFLVEPFRLLWDGTTQDNTTGLLVTFTFESKLSAPTGEYPVTLSYDAKNTNSEYGKPIAVEIEKGTITLTTGEYTVVYKNYDGTELLRKDYNANDIPAYSGETPTRETDERYSYIFCGWMGVVSNVENEVWYVAEYVTASVEYQVTFYVDGEFYRGDICGYDEVVDISDVPSKQNHTFSGWYFDEECTQKATFVRMPSNDLSLYGYMKFNIREDEIPKIKLTLEREEKGIAYVDVCITDNPALSGLILTLDYDKSGLEFIGFTRGETLSTLQFTHTNIENGLNADNFKFYWEGAVNSYETGTILTLAFNIKENATGMYAVTFTYDEKTDATFFTDEQELWYTKLEITGTNIPLGKLYHWYEETEEGIGIDVTTEEGQEPDTFLHVKRITYFVSVDKQAIVNVVGENTALKDVYFAQLMRGENAIYPNGKITVKIELTKSQKSCSLLVACRLEKNGTLSYIESKVEDGFVVFETDKLGEFAIVGDLVTDDVGGTTEFQISKSIWVFAPLLLAIVTMILAVIAINKAKRNGDSEDE